MRRGQTPSRKVTIAAGRPVDLTTAYFNCIWQGDANTQTLLSLEHTGILNITAPATYSTSPSLARRLIASRTGMKLVPS